ncbi:MAG: hypothetical protein A3B30_03980 [Candidatus Komeilibacteria bacterium RIFCSPLOWO2_01_FULL_52_15]|uniref:Uncharacterized protein n=2 Tax=Candidatus Komeiliibacteriota TaxID=1817908 RepID=A0A1G2BQC6_9BACT|nr:MAG: hypothetical protein A2677_00680 [Candidatus Komeilibacteria bacterium RIFCSPHIGHO2_01_FULL_52_14]OGY91322.1 MAG: hypothetical protein A3B30_03980 [Candidatus Komeilibacteria bacterium RIFCSPLOWO2_01_FULL_52_15]
MNIVPKERGFSLVEALVAIAMASIIVVVIGSSLGSVYRVYTASTMKQQAVAYAQESLELITAYRNSPAVFACIGGTPCTAPDTQQCTPLTGYNGCWTRYPRGIPAGAAQYHFVSTGGAWQLQSGAETIASNTAFSRAISLQNLCRDASGEIGLAGCTEDLNSKQVTATVSWVERGQTKSVQLQKILNGSKPL